MQTPFKTIFKKRDSNINLLLLSFTLFIIIYFVFFLLGTEVYYPISVISLFLLSIYIFINPVIGIFFTSVFFLVPFQVSEIQFSHTYISLVKIIGGITFFSWILNKLLNDMNIDFLKNFQTCLIFVFGGIVIISYFVSLDTILTYRYIQRYLQWVILYILFFDLIKKDNIHYLFWAIILGTLVNCFFAFYQRYYIGIIRVKGLYGSPNLFAAYCTFCIPLVYYFVQKSKLLISRILSLIIFILLIIFIGISESRGAFVSLTIVFLLLYFHLLKTDKKSAWILLILFIISLCSFFSQEFFERLRSAQYDYGSGRIFIWKDGIEMFKDNFLLGVGAGSFQVAYALKYGRFIAGKYVAAHNVFIEIAAELGIFGLLVYSCLILNVLKYFFRIIYVNDTEEYLKAVSAYLNIGFIGLIVWSIFGHLITLSKILFMIFGISAKLYLLSQEKEKEESSLKLIGIGS